MDQKALFCIGWHFKIWCEDLMNDLGTNFMRPCETCPKVQDGECIDTNWHKAAMQLNKETGIKVDCLIKDKNRYKSGSLK